jgi:NADH:ubiquinone oxidoreductase subunit 6 (subunit J)
MLLAGTLYEKIGAASYGAMAVIALIGAVVATTVWMKMSDVKR